MPIGIIVIIGAFVLAIFAILFNNSETHISTKNEQNTINILDCTTISPTKPFFKHNLEIKSEHRVKIEYINDSFSGLNFTYTGTYQSPETASEALSWLHADYNIYVAKTGVYQEDLFPTFSTIGSENVINLYLPKKYLNSGTAKFVFIDNDEFNSINNTSIQKMRELYENKGFTCNVTNN